MRWCILLTSCVLRNFSRAKCQYYRQAINAWLQKTTLPIFIVESSGYKFEEFKHTRLKIYTFNLSEPLASTSQYEAQSILAAIAYFTNDLKPYTHILKVTARYFVPNMPHILKSLVKPIDLVCQHLENPTIKHQNSEIFGIRKSLIPTLLETVRYKGLMEHALFKAKNTYKYCVLPPMKNYFKAARGGDNLCIDPL